MNRYNIILLLLIFFPIYLCAQQEYNIIRQDEVGNDTVVWKEAKNVSFISIFVKDDNDPNNRCLPKVPKGMSIEAYEGKVQHFIDNYIQCKLDSLNDVFLSLLSKESLEKMIPSSSKHPLILTFRIKENGEIHSVNAGIRKDVENALNSKEYYKFQSLIKHDFSFIAPSTIGLIGCITFILPIKKKQIKKMIHN